MVYRSDLEAEAESLRERNKELESRLEKHESLKRVKSARDKSQGVLVLIRTLKLLFLPVYIIGQPLFYFGRVVCGYIYKRNINWFYTWSSANGWYELKHEYRYTNWFEKDTMS